ncbi:MAG: phospholipase D-like domain-containing protein [Desulfuromonadales bacterium]|jgi:phosphatidylserine/phosphatidylglycerophosphate/cardiolipin synthase-like enzyme
MSLTNHKYRFPLREGNRFHLLIDGGEFFPAMLAAMAGARQYILMEMYLFESGQVADRFIAAMTAAAGRGVKVYLLLDDFGAFFLRKADRQRLVAGGVNLAFFNPLRFIRKVTNLARTHRKILVVDGEVAFTGGAGISDQFDPSAQPESFWHETMLAIRGPCVRDWQELFQEGWERWGGSLAIALPRPTAATDGAPGRVVTHSRTLARSGIMRAFINRIRQSEDRVWLATAYFLPTWKLRRALRRAALDGLDVRLLLPGPRTDHPAVRNIGHRFYEKMLRDGVRIFEYQPRFLHAKLLLGGAWLSIGSSNLDRWNHRWNLEANQELEDPALLAQVLDLFAEDFAASREVHYADWLRRPWLGRLGEEFWGWVMALVVWLSERRKNRSRSERRP